MSLLPALLPMAGGAHGRHLSPLLEDTWLMAAAILAMVLLVFVMCILGCTRLQRAPMFPSPFAPLDERGGRRGCGLRPDVLVRQL